MRADAVDQRHLAGRRRAGRGFGRGAGRGHYNRLRGCRRPGFGRGADKGRDGGGRRGHRFRGHRGTGRGFGQGGGLRRRVGRCGRFTQRGR
ncbi:hypothetical protein RZS08_30220, partial [Arthrospira platensis SPKY1]|nr:hypothetical protein [Arthrospira platensis SPKY1]